MERAKIGRKVREWLRRYLPAEVIGTCTALTGALAAYSLTGSYVIAAIGGTIGENIGYYGYFTVRETVRHYADHRHYPPPRRIVLIAYKTLRDMLVEFGPAEVFDSFLLRPFFMYSMPQVIPSFTWGILAGKLCADVTFYGFAIGGYELRKRWFIKPEYKPERKNKVVL
ncbi:MAG TPA: hypothetical protein VMR98_03750 [Candidatus Polarisedimenticolaceae bacterium]|nr:hypothetical protein [Candidatus Polarisedimenticolaceae bacterium]